jgi:hypothetical protein
MEPGSPDDLPDRVPWDKMLEPMGLACWNQKRGVVEPLMLAAWSAR